MGGISARLGKDSILLDPPIRDKQQLLAMMVERLEEHYELEDADQLLADIQKREDIGSTCLGSGCAVPHARTDVLDQTLIAAARLNPPLDIETPDHQPVSLVFLLAGPKKSAGLHLKMLSKLARLLHNETFRNELLGANDEDEFFSVICDRDT